jgi:hypothetical protein
LRKRQKMDFLAKSAVGTAKIDSIFQR